MRYYYVFTWPAAFLLLLGITASCQQKSLSLTQDEVSRYDVIAVVHAQRRNDELLLDVKRVFKGEPARSVSVPKGEHKRITPGIDYLVLALNNASLQNVDARLIKLAEADQAIAFLEKNLPCADPALRDQRKDGVCLQVFDPVCGCDNRTYGNSCEARRKGVTQFTYGECR
jgi:hypothetical protein